MNALDTIDRLKEQYEEGHAIYDYKEIYFFKKNESLMFETYSNVDGVVVTYDDDTESGYAQIDDVLTLEYQESPSEIPAGLTLPMDYAGVDDIVLYNIKFMQGIQNPKTIATIKQAIAKHIVNAMDYRYTILLPRIAETQPFELTDYDLLGAFDVFAENEEDDYEK